MHYTMTKVFNNMLKIVPKKPEDFPKIKILMIDYKRRQNSAHNDTKKSWIIRGSLKTIEGTKR